MARAAARRSRTLPFTVVIPARYASTRLPGKPLADIGGKPMIVRVAERALASGAESVIIATDNKAIAQAAKAHGLDTVMTRADHVSGTDRIAEVANKLAFDPAAIVVNVQGDEPMIAPELIRAAAQLLADDEGASVATACHPIRDAAEFLNPNAVKVALDRTGGALYFSRAPIPWPRDAFTTEAFKRAFANAFAESPGKSRRKLPTDLPCYRHIGIYAYRAAFLAQYSRLQPAPLEQFEALEQLRVLWHGYRIAVAVRDDAPEPGVDTPEDLDRVRKAFHRISKAETERPGKIDRVRKAR